MYIEVKLKAEIAAEYFEKNNAAVSSPRDGQRSGGPTWHQHSADLLGVHGQRELLPLRGQAQYRQCPDAEWLLRLTDNNRSWGFGLCYLYLRNLKGFQWSHKRIYRIYRKLELNLRIKPRKRLVRDKPEALSVPQAINEVWSMDFMHDQLEDGRSFRLFNVIDDFTRSEADHCLALQASAKRLCEMVQPDCAL